MNQANQTGASLKQLAGIPHADVLFLQRPGEEEVIPNEKLAIRRLASNSSMRLTRDLSRRGGLPAPFTRRVFVQGSIPILSLTA